MEEIELTDIMKLLQIEEILVYDSVDDHDKRNAVIDGIRRAKKIICLVSGIEYEKESGNSYTVLQ